MNHYREIKNIIHNDMGITKEDIRQEITDVLKQTIEIEVQKVLNDHQSWGNYITDYTRQRINKALANLMCESGYVTVDNAVKSQLQKQLAEIIVRDFDIEVKIKNHDER